MQITKFTQATGEVSLKKMGFRLTALKREEIASKLMELRDLLGVKHKVEDMQVAFTGAKKETVIIVNSG